MQSISSLKLSAADRPKIRYRYEVEGTGTFPLDMLRYDAAWPSFQQDVTSIVLSSLPARKPSIPEPVRIHLSSFSGPTVDRWASFGWQVL